MSTFYTEDHEWIKIEDEVGSIGITAYAAGQLGDITFVELPEVGDDVETGDALCSIESVKAASDIYAPMGGEIVEVNEALEDAPEIVNESAESDGWIVRIKLLDANDHDHLLSESDYQKYLGTLDS